MVIYYIKNGGDDGLAGTSEATAWATIGRLNTFMATGSGLEPGDRVRLERGSVFYEKLEIPTANDGTSTNKIIFEAYGTGDFPIISGFKDLTGWTSLGDDLYEIVDAGFPTVIQQLQINGVNRPKVDFHSRKRLITSNGTTTTLISTDLPSYDFTGGEGEVLTQKNDFVADTSYITSRSGDTLTITEASDYATKEFTYFAIQNMLETLQEDGDWMYSPSSKKITIYSPSADPATRNIRVSFRDRCINAVGNQWNEFHNIELQGANDEAFKLDSSRYAIIDGLIVKDTGLSGIGLWSTTDAIVRNCQFIRTYDSGLQQRNGSVNLLVENNYFEDVYPFVGSGTRDGVGGFSIYGGGDDTIYRGNTIINAGYVGLRFAGNNVLVEFNIVEGYCLRKTDGAAFYTYGGTNAQNTFINQVVNRNIAIASPLSGHLDASVGFYNDDNQNNTLFTENISINSPDPSFYNHNSDENNYSNNIGYGGWYGKLYIHNVPNELIRNSDFTGQTIVLRGKDETPYRVVTDLGETDIDSFGVINNNRFIFCSGDEFVAFTRHLVGGKRIFRNYSWAQWQTLRGKDTTSQITFLNIPEYNITSLGANKFTGDGTFESAVLTGTNIFYAGGTAVREIDTTSKITGTNSLRARVTSESTQTTSVDLSFQLGALVQGEAYELVFDILAPSGHQSLNIYFNLSPWPYTRLTRQWHFIAKDTVKQIKFAVDKFYPVASCAMVISFQSDQGDIYLDNLNFRKITGTKTDYTDYLQPIYNATQSTANALLPTGYWKDIDDNPLTSPVSLAAFESKLIFTTVPPTDPKLGTSLFFEDWELGTYTNWNDGGEVDSSYIPASASSVIVSDYGRSGSNSLRMRAKSEGQTNNWRFREISDNDDIIITYHLYFPERIDMVDSWDSFFNLAQFKGVNLSGDFRNDPIWVFGINVRGGKGTGGANYLGLSYLGQFWSELGLGQYSVIPEVTLDIPIGQWWKFQIRYKKSASDGIVQAWQDDVLLFEIRNVVTFPSSLVEEVFTSINNYGFERLPDNSVDTTDVYLDDVSFNLLSGSYDFGDPEPATNYNITTSVFPEGSGTVTGAGDYEEGETATLTAFPDTENGKQFKRFLYNDTEFTENPHSFPMPANNLNVVVEFENTPEPEPVEYIRVPGLKFRLA